MILYMYNFIITGAERHRWMHGYRGATEASSCLTASQKTHEKIAANTNTADFALAA